MAAKKKQALAVASLIVFISYAWADEVSALAIDQWLRNHGARVLIDRRDFLPGNDIEAEIVRCVRKAGKVVCIYSRNSATRPYPELERRITAALEKQQVTRGKRARRLLYFCIDDTSLPMEALPRIAITASEMDFETACQELWRAILGKAAAPKQLNLSELWIGTPNALFAPGRCSISRRPRPACRVPRVREKSRGARRRGKVWTSIVSEGTLALGELHDFILLTRYFRMKSAHPP